MDLIYNINIAEKEIWTELCVVSFFCYNISIKITHEITTIVNEHRDTNRHTRFGSVLSLTHSQSQMWLCVRCGIKPFSAIYRGERGRSREMKLWSRTKKHKNIVDLFFCVIGVANICTWNLYDCVSLLSLRLRVWIVLLPTGALILYVLLNENRQPKRHEARHRKWTKKYHNQKYHYFVQSASVYLERVCHCFGLCLL